MPLQHSGARYVACLTLTPTGPSGRRMVVTASQDSAGQALRWLRRHLRAALPQLDEAGRQQASNWLADAQAYRKTAFDLGNGQPFTASWQSAGQTVTLAAARPTGRPPHPALPRPRTATLAGPGRAAYRPGWR